MMGQKDVQEQRGIIPRTFSHFFSIIQAEKSKTFLIRCSYLEIYNEKLRDLLSPNPKTKLELKESPDRGPFVKDLKLQVAKTTADLERMMELGASNRSIGETAMNKDSSRSHCLFTIYIEICENESKKQNIRAGKLHLVDLAGSERQSKTNATGDRLKEASSINLSLSALGNVISALVGGKSKHIPYRDSKLTRLLADSLGGNTKTLMIAAISPSDFNYEETLSTLRYASRAKQIKNKPKVNEDAKDTMLREYAQEISRLKKLLNEQNYPVLSETSTLPSGVQSEVQEVQREAEIKDGSEEDEEKLKILKNLNEREAEIAAEKKRRADLEEELRNLQQKFFNVNVIHSQDLDYRAKVLRERERKLAEREKEMESQKPDSHYNGYAVDEGSFSILDPATAEAIPKSLLVKRYNRLVKVLRAKCLEIRDLEQENYLEKEEYLDGLRLMDRENKFLNQVVKMLLEKREVEKIRKISRWKDEKNNFQVPPFVLKDKMVSFPKMSKHDGNILVHHQKDNRELSIIPVKVRVDQLTVKKGRKDSAVEQSDDEYKPDFETEEEELGKEKKRNQTKTGVNIKGDKKCFPKSSFRLVFLIC